VIDASESAQPHMQSGAALYQQRDLVGARREFAAALAVQPNLSPARFNLGVICRELEENDEAQLLFEEVIAAGEILAESYNNLGILAVRREAFEIAETHFREAIRLLDQFPLAHFNLGTLLLRMGRTEEGWREYEWRWQTSTFTPIQCPQPQWNGERLDGGILLHTEQGIGDTLQFSRFIPLIRERCRRLIFVRPDHLDCMFPPELWADEVRSTGEIALDSFQVFLPLMSAPYALGIGLDEIPLRENYLTPARRQIDLGPPHVADAKLKVGIVWRGSPTHINDQFRSTSVENFSPLFGIAQIAFYSLQLGARSEDMNFLAQHAGVVRDLTALQSDLADTAAIVKQLDLVITVDTALLHLSAGMGLPTWGLISRRSDWRWLGNEVTDSVWYPSLRLFRQQRLNDWSELMRRVAKELRALL